MTEKYFIAVRPQLNGNHSVHKDNCPFLPEYGKRKYLGQFTDPNDALNEGKKHYSSSHNCLFCTKKQESKLKDLVLAEITEISNLLTSERVTVALENTFMCCVN
jgi:hypothetical protein